MSCPLCHTTENTFYSDGHGREYHQCQNCSLVFVQASFHLSPAEEAERYRRHDNVATDPAYRAIFSELLEALDRISWTSFEALDFGAGADPALKPALEERGFKVQLYDPLFHPDSKPLEATYPLVTCTEVLEHLRKPVESIEQLKTLIRPGGILGIMTRLIPENIPFKAWHYPRDPTHICFWNPKSFEYMANRFGFQILELESKYQILRLSKPN